MAMAATKSSSAEAQVFTLRLSKLDATPLATMTAIPVQASQGMVSSNHNHPKRAA